MFRALSIAAAITSLIADPAMAETPATLSPEVTERVHDLRAHGGRFDAAVALIEAESQIAAYRWESVETAPAVDLPADVAKGVEELRAHGDRFAKAIARIEAAALKHASLDAPADCTGAATFMTASLPLN